MSPAYNPFDIAGNDALLRSLLSGGRAARLGHAYALAGPEGSGRHSLAKIMAAAALCLSEDTGRPCKACRSCKKTANSLHPDVTLVSAPDTGPVTVDTIRALRRDIYIAPVEGQRKIYIVEKADAMTPQAQNALLKVLEEPPRYGMIILLCETAGALLPTLLSRAAVLRLSPVAEKEGARVLMRRIPGLDAETAEKAMRASGGYIGAAQAALSNGEDEKLAGLIEMFKGLLTGKSKTAFLALHARLSQNRAALLAFSAEMHRVFLAGTRRKAAGGELDKNSRPGAPAFDKTLLLPDIFRDTMDRIERNANVSLCAFYMLVMSWEATH